jgi:biopolymer transport protein ExbD
MARTVATPKPSRRRRRFCVAIGSNETPVDLTPMIDVVFLLLIFFILTMTFVPEERNLAALMPNSGTGTPVKTPILPPPTVRISVVPAGMPVQATEHEYETFARAQRAKGMPERVTVRMGGETIGEVDFSQLLNADAEIAQKEMARIHALIHAGLASRETEGNGARSIAPPVEIHAWSGLPWAGVTTIYDGVRAYEAEVFHSIVTDRFDIRDARPLAFAAPPLRNHSPRSDGTELFELMHLN